MQTADEQIQYFRNHYSKADLFMCNGVQVQVVAYICWQNKKEELNWVFKLSNKVTIKVKQ